MLQYGTKYSEQALSASDNLLIHTHTEELEKEISGLKFVQARLRSVISLLSCNTDANSAIIATRTKQLKKITNALDVLNQEYSFLVINSNFTSCNISNYSPPSSNNINMNSAANISLSLLNGTTYAFSDGTLANSCNSYRYPTLPYVYNNEGSGLYRIKSDGSEMTVYCDMTTDGGGWTLIAGIRGDYQGPYFGMFNSTELTPRSTTSFAISSIGLLRVSTQIRVANDLSTPFTTFYTSNWEFSASCIINDQLRTAITVNPNSPNNGDIPATCSIISGLTKTPTHYNYGRTYYHSTGLRVGWPYPDYPGNMIGGSWGTFSYPGDPLGFHQGNYIGICYAFGCDNWWHGCAKNGVVFLR